MIPRRAPGRFAWSGLLLVASAILLLRPLAAFWNRHDDYAYGWGVPFLAAYLLAGRWQRRPDPAEIFRCGRNELVCIGILAAWSSLFLVTRLIIETEPASRPLLWLDASLLVAAVLAWFGLQGGWGWVRHFTFPLAFLLLSVPWIFQLEWFVVQGLMRWNAQLVAATLSVLDVQARAAGNTILLSNGQLGITRACSGIRSLQAALMLSIFFGEFYLFRARGRLGLVATGFGIAMLGNFARMLFLAWRAAHEGVASVEEVHDSAGILILSITLVSLWMAGFVFEAKRPMGAPCTTSLGPRATPRLAVGWGLGIFVAVICSEVVTQTWYGLREKVAPHVAAWTVAWPAEAQAFRSLPIPPASRERLHYWRASGAEWRDGTGWSWSGLWFRYQSGAEDKIVFGAHNPELCLPAAGWARLADQDTFEIDRQPVRLPVQAYRFDAGYAKPFVFWITYLNRGTLPQADRASHLYGHSLAALTQLRFPWWQDVWAGCRGADAETLEVAVNGPRTLAEAEQEFRREIIKIVVPDESFALEQQAR